MNMNHPSTSANNAGTAIDSRTGIVLSPKLITPTAYAYAPSPKNVACPKHMMPPRPQVNARLKARIAMTTKTVAWSMAKRSNSIGGRTVAASRSTAVSQVPRPSRARTGVLITCLPWQGGSRAHSGRSATAGSRPAASRLPQSRGGEERCRLIDLTEKRCGRCGAEDDRGAARYDSDEGLGDECRAHGRDDPGQRGSTPPARPASPAPVAKVTA